MSTTCSNASSTTHFHGIRSHPNRRTEKKRPNNGESVCLTVVSIGPEKSAGLARQRRILLGLGGGAPAGRRRSRLRRRQPGLGLALPAGHGIGRRGLLRLCLPVLVLERGQRRRPARHRRLGPVHVHRFVSDTVFFSLLFTSLRAMGRLCYKKNTI